MILRNINEALAEIDKEIISKDKEGRINLFDLGETKIFLSAFKLVPENIEEKAEAWLVLQGKARIQVENEQILLKKGDFIKIEPGENHSWKSDEGIVLLGFDPNPCMHAC